MKVLVDTCIWSHALRSKNPAFEAQVKILENLIADQRVLIIGAIRQEVLSGYSDLRQQAKNNIPVTILDTINNGA